MSTYNCLYALVGNNFTSPQCLQSIGPLHQVARFFYQTVEQLENLAIDYMQKDFNGSNSANIKIESNHPIDSFTINLYTQNQQGTYFTDATTYAEKESIYYTKPQKIILLDADNQVISYNGKICPIRKKSGAYYCLTRLFSNPESTVPTSEALNSCKGIFDFKNLNEEKKVPDSCRHLNNRLKKRLGIENLLLVKNNSVLLNEAYRDHVRIKES